MNTSAAIVVASIIVSFTGAWVFRYDMVVSPGDYTIFTQDRWTGEISMAAPTNKVLGVSRNIDFSHAPLINLNTPSYRDGGS